MKKPFPADTMPNAWSISTFPETFSTSKINCAVSLGVLLKFNTCSIHGYATCKLGQLAGHAVYVQ